MKPTIPEVMPLLREFMTNAENRVGGNLHIVLDERNVADSDVRHCIRLAEARGDLVGEELGRKLLAMSKTQRFKIGAIAFDLADDGGRRVVGRC